MGFTGKRAAMFREAFIMEFKRMKLELSNPIPKGLPDFRNPIAAAEAWIQSEKDKLLLETENKELETEIKRQEPKVKAYEKFMEIDRLLNMRETAKLLGEKPLKLTQALRDAGIFFKTEKKIVPKQQYVDRGYFELKVVNSPHSVWSGSQTFITPKGIGWLSRKIDNGYLVV